MTPVRRQIRERPLATGWLFLMLLTLIVMIAAGVPWSL